MEIARLQDRTLAREAFKTDPRYRYIPTFKIKMSDIPEYRKPDFYEYLDNPVIVSKKYRYEDNTETDPERFAAGFVYWNDALNLYRVEGKVDTIAHVSILTLLEGSKFVEKDYYGPGLNVAHTLVYEAVGRLGDHEDIPLDRVRKAMLLEWSGLR